jgi:hypothetical protein
MRAIVPKRVFSNWRGRGITADVSLGREGKAEPQNWAKSGQPATVAMRRRLASKRGQQWYRKRKSAVEPVFGWIKQVLGFRRFSLRGLERVRGEWQLVCVSLNLKRLCSGAGGLESGLRLRQSKRAADREPALMVFRGVLRGI